MPKTPIFQTEFPDLFDSLSASNGLHRDTDTALLQFVGAEARSFLQNQLSNDLRLVSPAQAQLAGYVSPKGRLLAVVTVQQLGEQRFVLRLPSALAAPTLKRLKMFVLRSAVTASDATAELATLGLIGAQAAQALVAQGFSPPEAPYAASAGADTWLLRLPGPVPRFELVGSPEVIAHWQQALALPPVPTGAWGLAALAAGTPQIAPETVDAFVPQTADLDLAGGISFTKGCYPGQEIVARVHYLGRAKQRLFWARSAQPPAAGAAVLDAQGRPAGTVMAAAPAPTGGALVLAVLPLTPPAPLQTVGGAALSAVTRVHPDPASDSTAAP